MKKIQVLMSTYNGEKYLREQIDSILNQTGNIIVSLLVRDDGSTDETLNILKQYEKNNKIKWYQGKNLGPAKSFLDLIKNSDKADYYAFSDQDDFWEPDKLINAVNHLDKKKYDAGKLYYSSLNIVDQDLNFKRKTVIDEEIDFKKGIVRNQATGCTMVFNNYIRTFLLDKDFDYVGMHDSLLYRLALLYDWYIYRDDKSYIKYRQHENNVLGMSYSKFGNFKKKIRRFFNDESEASLISKELLKLPNICHEKKEYLFVLSNYKNSFRNKIKLLFMRDYKCNNFVSDLTIKIKIILNRL